jgi:hypothetical protein
MAKNKESNAGHDQDQSEDRLAIMEGRLSALESENVSLKEQLHAIHKRQLTVIRTTASERLPVAEGVAP